MMNPEPVAPCTWTKIRLDHHNILNEGKKTLALKNTPIKKERRTKIYNNVR